MTSKKLVPSKSNSAVQCYNVDGIEYYIAKATGETGMSVRGLAKVCGVHHSSVVRRLAQIGFKPTADAAFGWCATNEATVVPEDVCSEVIKYYAYQGKENAQATLDMLVKAGFRAAVYRQCGYTIEARKDDGEGSAYIRKLNAQLFPTFTDALQNIRKKPGDVHFHARYVNMLNRIVFGCSAQQYTDMHGVSPRDGATKAEGALLNELQTMAATLLKLGGEFLEYKNLKKALEQYAAKQQQKMLLDAD